VAVDNREYLEYVAWAEELLRDRNEEIPEEE
jgi:hypothetical protein